MKFSCIIGTYNPKAEWLQRAVLSTQGLFDEVIIVNDGTDDGGVGVFIGNYLKDIKVINHEINKGFYEAKNTAIKAATGDIIITLDDDDYFNADGVLKLKDWIQGSTADIWHFKLQEFGLSSGVYGEGANPKELTSHNSIPGISWYRKSMWEKLGGFTYSLAEDWDFWLRAYKAGYKFDYFPEIVYNFNVRNGSVSRGWIGPIFDKIRKEILERNNII